MGWGSIVYLAAIAGISNELYEAAAIDGSNRFTNAVYITLPSIAPTITVFLLLNISRILNNSFEQFDSMQNAVNLTRSEVLATFIYRTGISARRYSYTTAVGAVRIARQHHSSSHEQFYQQKDDGTGNHMRKIKKYTAFDYINMIFLTLFGVVTIYPFYYVVIGAFSNGQTYMSGGVFFAVRGFTLDNFKAIIGDSTLWTAFRNSALRTAAGVASGLLFTSLVAYAMAARI